MSIGFFMSTLAMGFYMSSLLVSLVDRATGRWLKSNLNAGRLENFYALLAVLGVLNLVLFLFFARRHEYKVQQQHIGLDCEKELQLQSWENGDV